MQGIAKVGQVRDPELENASETREQSVLKERLELLYASVGLSQMLAIFVAYILYKVHTGYHDVPLAESWLALAISIFGVRGALGYLYRFRPNLFSGYTWLSVSRTAAIAAGVMWGLTGLVFFPPDNQTLQILTLLVLAGVSAGALSSTASDFFSYAVFMCLALVPPAVIGLMGSVELQQALGLLTSILLLLLLKTGKVYAQSIDNSFQLRYQNADLIEDLEREKTRAIKDAETMVGTILACAPVAIWTTDNEGRINLIDGQQLPVDPKMARPEVGDNIFSIFEKSSQVINDTSRALRGETFRSELESLHHTYEMHYSPFLDADGNQQGMIGVAIDISDRKRHEKELAYRADYDQLTGLPNRNLILNQVDQAFRIAKRQQKLVAVFFLDLDNFKTINDTMGHRVGDELLRQVAKRLKKTLRESDIPARLGGDEFLIVAENLTCTGDAEKVAKKIANTFEPSFVLDNREVFISTSIGISVFPHDGDSANKLLQCADTAMYHAKVLGKNNFRFFSKEMQLVAERHLSIETELRGALENDELSLVYQPKVKLPEQNIEGAEVLLRWASKKLGPVSPAEFIPVAEIAGLMPKLGNWVIERACEDARAWLDAGGHPTKIAINISSQQFRTTDLSRQIKQSLSMYRLDPTSLELEITESLLVQDAPETIRTFDELIEMGVSLALDDFGTGYSSLSYLKKFPMQVLKIDRSFVNDLGINKEAETLVDAIIGMAKSLKLEIVAEGVETEEQLAYLQDRGVCMIQGYYFSPPVDEPSFRQMLKEEPFVLVPETDEATYL